MTNHPYSRTLTTAAAVFAMVTAAVPGVYAQEHRAAHPAHVPSSAAVVFRPAPPRVIAPRVVVSGPVVMPRQYVVAQRGVAVARPGPRVIGVAGSRVIGPRFAGPRVAGPRVVGPRVVGPRSVEARVIGPRAVISPAVRPRIWVAPTRFYRPYYVFQPRTRLGLGLVVGFPVAYAQPYYVPFYAYPYAGYPTYGYAYPAYSYPYPTYPTYSYPTYAAPGSVAVQPGQANTGGVSFEITPDTAELFVDGVSFGMASQFTPNSQPLGLATGHHHFEVRAPGYQTMTFDADVVAGQVIPFQATMER